MAGFRFDGLLTSTTALVPASWPSAQRHAPVTRQNNRPKATGQGAWRPGMVAPGAPAVRRGPVADARASGQGKAGAAHAADAAGGGAVCSAQGRLPALLQQAGIGAVRRALTDWRIIGRAEQQAPEGDWRLWLMLGGRGSGKTRAGAEWTQRMALLLPGARIALVAETLGDAREVMIDGVSGIRRIGPARLRPDYEASRRRLVWPNGSIGQVFSSEDPDSLRGPQFHFAWSDELAKWKYVEAVFDMLQFGLRLGDAPRQIVTTTPRAIPLLGQLIAAPGTVTTRMRTADNSRHLAPGFLAGLAARYGGTRLGRQELDGELIADREDTLFRRAMIETCQRPGPPPSLRRIVVGVDPPAGAGRGSCCGIVVAGLAETGEGVVLADCSVEGLSPTGWAAAVTAARRRFAADRVVAEANQGGEMVRTVLTGLDPTLPVALVRATRGKFTRAEPVAALYEQGRILHAGRFPALEDQMADFGPDGLSGGRSPDRLDALVWALTALMIDAAPEPRVRGM